jgi:hypothetical protein
MLPPLSVTHCRRVAGVEEHSVHPHWSQISLLDHGEDPCGVDAIDRKPIALDNYGARSLLNLALDTR